MPLTRQWQVEATVFASSGLAPLKAQPRVHPSSPQATQGPASVPCVPRNPTRLRPSALPSACTELAAAAREQSAVSSRPLLSSEHFFPA